MKNVGIKVFVDGGELTTSQAFYKLTDVNSVTNVIGESISSMQMWNIYIYIYIFFYLVFFHEHSRITGLQGKGEGISLTPHYHFHPIHRHLDISRAITAESSPLHLGSSRTRTVNLWFPSASR